MAANRYSVGSLASLASSSGDGTSIDCSFISTSSSGSLGYEIESEVGREALKEICCSALSRTLDFPDSQLETLLGFEEENESAESSGVNVARNITASFRSMKRGLSALYHHHHHQQQQHQYARHHIPPQTTVTAGGSLSFGSAITEAGQDLLLQLISHMTVYVASEGLFRKSGNKSRMEQLVKGLEEGQFESIILNQSYHANDFASVLKQYFSELPEPLLLKRHLSAYLQASELSSLASTQRCLQLLMLLLPPIHRVILQHLLDLLYQVTKAPDNKMDSHNLSLIFAPTLFLAARSESLPPESFEKLSRLLACMIENSEDIFEVPAEVQVVAERYCKKKRLRNANKSTSSGSLDLDTEEEETAEDVVLDVYSTSCKRQCAETFHEDGKERAMDEVAKLYELVKNMPDGPQKAHFMKRFESASKAGCTPPSVVKKKSVISSLSRLRRSSKKNKENATPKATPKVTREQIKLVKPCFKKGSLIGEFDQVDSTPILTPSTKENVAPVQEDLMKTPMATDKDSDVFRTPRPSGSCEGDTFKTPMAPVYRVQFIPTKSPMVTDV